ncbi:hypothetical protein M9Y10_023187 [Tritrichomonas musculus]|uniref:Uncharacterized protein n=1 Tax=Tritrichomonas musculus TaxID=1915356 RepID=A0ABR2KUG6_9EUKA
MIPFFALFVSTIYSITESDPEIDTVFFKAPILSDFVNSRQLRNLTISGQNELTPIFGQYFTKTMFNLLPSLNPTYLTFRSMYFTKFDGMLINGESKGLAKFADLYIYDCNFIEGNSNIMNIQGPDIPKDQQNDYPA